MTAQLFKGKKTAANSIPSSPPKLKPSKLMRLRTPVEEYSIRGRKVLVKRDDLMGDNERMPPWGKLHAIRALLSQLPMDKPIMHLNVFGSWSGWALARLIGEMSDAPVHIVHPKTKRITDDYLGKIEESGGVLVPVRHNMMRVLYAKASNIAKEKHYQMLPFAFDHGVYLSAMCARLVSTLKEIEAAHGPVANLVVSSGSGVTVAGLTEAFLSVSPKGKVFTICVSSEKTIELAMRKWITSERASQAITIIKSPYAFEDSMPTIGVPFSCNQHWDKKAWHWLDQNIKKLRGVTLFWNLGGENTWV